MPRPYSHRLLAVVISMCAFGSASAAYGELPVNNELPFRQLQPDVAVAAEGTTLVAWQSEDSEFGVESIKARLFRRGGQPVAAEFPVDEPNLPGRLPAVAALGGGKFLIAWEAGGRVIRARIFDAAGTPVGGPFDASWDGWPPTASACVAVAAAEDGRFAIAWVGFEGYIQIQRYAADATMAGSRMRLDPVSDEQHMCPSLAFDRDGNFAVAWLVDELVPGGLVTSVWLKRFAADGSSRGERVKVDDGNLFVFAYPSLVSSPEGDLLVAWAGETGGLGTEKAMAQRFSGAGVAQGGNFLVYERGFAVDAAGDAEGNVVVVVDTAGSLNGIVARRIAADGSFIGGMSQVSNDFDQQVTPAVSANPQGEFVAAWTAVTGNGQDPTMEDIVRSEPTSILSIFADGFESADISRWN